MHNNQHYIELCSELLSNEFHAQLIHPELERAIGEKSARVLSQLHYWLNKCGKEVDGQVWVYNTVKQWQENFVTYSQSTIRRIIKNLEKLELVVSKQFNLRNWNQCKSYTICYDKLAALLLEAKAHSKQENRVKQCSKPHISAVVQNERLELFNLTNSYTKNNKANINNNLSCESSVVTEERPVTNIRKKEEDEISKEMISIWNEVIPNEKVYLSDRREKKLLVLWNNHCDRDIGKWREFCIKVNSSQFLMGEKKKGFRAHFDWIIEESTVVRVLNGDFGIGDRIPDSQREEMARKQQEALEITRIRLEAERIKREEEEAILRREREAEILARQELAKIESAFTEEDVQYVKAQFVEYLNKQEEYDTPIGSFAKQFKQRGWRAMWCDHFFESFKLEFLLSERKIIAV